MDKELTLKRLHENLDELLEPALFKDYCPNGLQVEGKDQIRSIATAVSASLETIESAIDAGVDALIVHHGLFWSGDPFPIVDTKRKKIAKRPDGIKCVIMVPTRELAEQITKVFLEIGRHTSVKTYSIFGGVDQDPQISKLDGEMITPVERESAGVA